MLYYRSTNPFGWPRLVVSVYGSDLFGRSIVVGYGSIIVPTCPGRFVNFVPLFTPVPPSTMERFTTWLSGQRIEFHDSKFVGKSQGRELTRVSSLGSVKVAWSVTTRNMAALGYAQGSAEHVEPIVL
eukprot:TRINITY_DN7871_c0_g1_i2.p1 TRINITY_DN7871_c0_g1~~TRINITY_DN7871_c0_g1_i2.p1  ORF type:complete len:127 (+),score=2.96 TRINITY_DN7871_c0_g1_i2:132-512(+)